MIDARRILVISERLPRRDESGGSRRLATVLELLARRHVVDLWVERDETTGRSALAPARVTADRARVAADGVSLMPSTWRALDTTLAGARYDAVLFEFYQMAARYAPVVRDRQPLAATIVDSVDVHFARLRAGASIGAVPQRLARRTRRAELRVYRAADAVMVTSEHDANTLAEEPGLPPVYCVPDALPERPRLRATRPREALFIGHFHHAPNVDGIRWFVHDIWPAVRARHADAQLTIIGTYATAEVRALGAVPGVSVVGYVPDTQPFLDRASVAIAPLRYGAGMKGKVTEAMAAGVPVVTTSAGIQGLGVVHGEHLLVSDDGAGFATSVTELFANPEEAHRIGTAGQEHIREICSTARVEHTLETLIAESVARRLAARTPVTHAPLLAQRARHWKLACWYAAVTAARRRATRLNAGSPAAI